jgi:hypothetical protein
MPAPPSEYALTKRHDDFVLLECPDDKEYLEPYLPIGSRHGSKALAAMAIDGSVPQGAIFQQYDKMYLFYDGLLWQLGPDKHLVNPEDPMPAFEPVYNPKSSNREPVWRRFSE